MFPPVVVGIPTNMGLQTYIPNFILLDKKRIDDFKLAGYTCLTFWETDIRNNLDEIKQQIINEYNKK
jgi:very-short-patch-repair endonuclease